MSEDLSGKTVIVTGGNTGIGRVTAFELARLKAEVIIIGRNKETCETAVKDISALTKNDKVSYHIVDLGSFKSIAGFVQEFSSSHNTLDILVNNAGVMTPPVDVTEDNLDATVGINYMGHFYLTHLLGEMLVKSKARVVVLSAEAHKKANITLEQLEGDVPAFMQPVEKKSCDTDWAQFAISNRAKIYFAKELSARQPDITAVSVHPGVVSTDLFRSFNVLFKCFGICFRPFLKTPQQGAATTLHCCTGDMSGHKGEYFIDSKPSELAAGTIDPAVQKKLWDVSVALCEKLGK